MTVREVLDAAYEAALELRRIDEEAQARRDAIGPQGYHVGVHAKTTILDPSRHIDELIDWERTQRMMPSIAGPIDEAWDVLSGVSTFVDDSMLSVVTRHYLNAESWREVCAGNPNEGFPPIAELMPSMAGMRRSDQALVLQRSVEASIGEWEEIGIAHLKAMGREAECD